MPAPDNKFKWGQLTTGIDDIPHGDPKVAGAIYHYAHSTDVNRHSRHWKRTVGWVENILFGLGRHYVDDILTSRVGSNSSGDLSVVREVQRSIPRPTNDFIGRYVETNISLLTENRPRPRVTPKSDRRDDRMRAELSELNLEYLWEKLDMPELHREIARLLMYCGVCWLEVIHDPMEPRFMTVPATEQEALSIPGPGGEMMQTPLQQQVPVFGPDGSLQFENKQEYGDITARVVSPFEMHLPNAHRWGGEDMGWVMREMYMPVETLKDKYARIPSLTTKKNGWFLENLEGIQGYGVDTLPIWWWERLSDAVEGPGPSMYIGAPEQWANHTVVRVYDRKPSKKWPKGRTVILAGDRLLYDSPKDVGARAYDKRWPDRWHPYIRYRWEAMPGSIYGRSLVSKLLPKLKRVNAIDTTLIMWRRTVPIATWLVPKGAVPVEDIFSGRPGTFWEFDPQRTMQMAPQPVFPPSYPSAALEERQRQIEEMESIAGTEDILRGQRPTGVNSAAMLEAIRRHALSSRSPTLQTWDESLQKCGEAMLQETIKHVQNDHMRAERIRILAREKASRITIQDFSGTDLSDNVQVRVDTASMAYNAQEAKQARAVELIQYGKTIMEFPPTLRKRLMEDLGYPDAFVPQGSDITRVQTLIGWVKQNRFDLVVPFPEDDPYVFHDFLVEELKSESFIDLSEDQKRAILALIDHYRDEIVRLETQRIDMQQKMMAAQTPLPEEGMG